MSDLLMLLVKTREWEYGSTDLPSHVYQHDSKRKANRKYTKLRPGITLSQSFIILKVALGARPSRHQKLKTWPEPSRRGPLSSGSSRDVPLPLAALYWPQLDCRRRSWGSRILTGLWFCGGVLQLLLLVVLRNVLWEQFPEVRPVFAAKRNIYISEQIVCNCRTKSNY